MAETYPEETGIYKGEGYPCPCDVCGTTMSEYINIESERYLQIICSDCAKLCGAIGEEIEPSGGGV